jgi:glutaconate CoA-transferase subunit B
MAVATARFIQDRQRLFIGTGLPMIAAYLAKSTHAPQSVLVFESGVFDARPRELARGVGDPRLVVSAPYVSGMFDALMLLHGGRIDLGILGAAQVDPFGNINTTVIGEYRHPKVRLPGSGGANDIASLAQAVLIVTRHEPRKFVARLDYVTTPGHLYGTTGREAAGLRGAGPIGVVTDLCVMTFAPATKRMVVESLHPGVTFEEVQDSTGFDLEPAPNFGTTIRPSAEEIELLRTVIDPAGIYVTKPSEVAWQG